MNNEEIKLEPIRGSKEKAKALYELDLAIGEIEYAIIWEEEEMSIKEQKHQLKRAVKRLVEIRELFL